MSHTDPYVRLADLEDTVGLMERSMLSAIEELKSIDQQSLTNRTARGINYAIGELETWVK